MACYVIGIGGTGAKCVEALIHLCAAGLMPDKKNAAGEIVGPEDLYVAFVDSDVSNGSLDRARNTLTKYMDCKQNRFGSIDLFKTQLHVGSKDGRSYNTWSPFGEDDQTQPRLDNFFNYASLNTSPQEDKKRIAHLFDVLYSPEEKTTTLEKGFRGHPSIGAAVLSSTVKFSGSEPWQTFKNRINLDIAGEGARIILIGSIFGGTGAAGLPTIARLIRDEFNLAKVENSRLGGILVLPYFSFNPPEEGGMRADSENFLLNTKAALKYYHQQATAGRKMGLDVFQAMYTLGEAQLSPVAVPSLGSKSQRNEQHVIELYAALACLNFFDRAQNPAAYNMVAREKESEINWTDLPNIDNAALKSKLGQMSRYAFAYLSSYYPAINDLNRRASYRAPWYVNFFERRRLDVKENQTKLDNMRDYCEMYLLWLANICWSAKNLQVKLFNNAAFSEVKLEADKEKLHLKERFSLGEFDHLILPEDKKSPNGLQHLWEDMCIASVRDRGAEGIGKFFHALYLECSV
jgi:hypothetical protein